MKKTDLIDQVAARSGLTKKEAELALNATLEAITQALARGDKVQLLGFGSFEPKERAPRTGLNPKTLEPVDIPASRSVSFRPGKALKDAVAL